MVFPSIEAAAIDALVYTYLRASDERDTERMRAGTIYSVETRATATARSMSPAV